MRLFSERQDNREVLCGVLHTILMPALSSAGREGGAVALAPYLLPGRKQDGGGGVCLGFSFSVII
jgi:hypothetical protein